MAALDVIGLDVVLVWFRLWVCFLGFFFFRWVCLFVCSKFFVVLILFSVLRKDFPTF